MSNAIPTTRRHWKRYPTYKESGIPWLGAIPKHWDALRLKWVVSKIGSGKTPKGGGEVYSNSGVLFLRSQNVHFDGLRLDEVVYIDETIDREMSSTRILPEDVLLNITGASLGRCCAVPMGLPSANVNQHVCILRPRRSLIAPGFLNACIASPSVQSQIFSSENGVSREGLNYTQTANLVFAIPPKLNEQRAISAFLNRETARLNALIERKERLIALLLEKRQAVISHAVTRGLDPTAPLKDSGIPWLGMVPKHWAVRRLKHACSLIKDGTHLPPLRTATGFPLLSVRNIVEGQFVTLPDDSTISEADFLLLRKALEVKKDDVLLAIVGATIGKVAVVGELPPFAIQRSLAVLRPKVSLLRHQFLAYFLQSSAFQRLLWQQVSYSAQPGIYLGALENFNVPLPDDAEQAEIVAFVEKQTEALNTALTRIRDGVARLQEYRTALVSAAVTGQIDVRHEVAP